MEVCKWLVKHQDGYMNLFDTLPTQAISDAILQIDKQGECEAEITNRE